MTGLGCNQNTIVTYLRRCHYLDNFAVLDASNVVQKVEVQCVCVCRGSGDRYKESCGFLAATASAKPTIITTNACEPPFAYARPWGDWSHPKWRRIWAWSCLPSWDALLCGESESSYTTGMRRQVITTYA